MPRNNILTGGILPTSAFAPAVFQGNTFTPQQADTSLLARSLDKIEQRELATSQQRGAIAKALSELELNPAEDQWRTDYANNIQDQISGLIQFGDYSGALNRAAILAGDMYTNPGLRGRLRAQQDYKKFVDDTQKRTDIDQRTKNWALATNPYSYADITDDKGNVVGGTEWQPSNRPVGQIDLSKLGSLALSWVKPNKSSGTSAMFVDSDGNFTKDISKAVDVAYTTQSGVEYLGKDKLREAINAAIDMTPGGRAAIEQDYKVAEWEYTNLTPEQKANIGETEFTDSNGRPLTREEFLAKKINPWVNAAAYSNSESHTSYGSGLATARAIKQQKAADAMALSNRFSNGQINYTGTGFNVTYDTSDYLATAQGGIEDAIRAIEGAMPKITDTKQWKQAKAEGNYLALENIIRNTPVKSGQKYFNITNDKVKKIVNNALRTINNNYSFVAETFKGTDKKTKEAILFRSAIDAGQRLPDNNENSRAFYGLLNGISNGKPAERYKITFNDKSDVDDFLTRMGMNESTARQNGIEFGYDNGFTTVTIKQNSNFLPKAVMNFFDASDDFFSLPWNRSRITALDNNGKELGSSKRGTLLDNIGERLVGSWTTANHFNNLRQIVDGKVGRFNAAGRATKSTDQLKIADIPAIANAKRKYGIDSPEYSRAKQEINDDLALRLSGSDWTQFGVYGYDENTRGLTVMPNADRGEQMSNIISHIQSNDADIQFGTNGIQHGYYVTLHKKRDNKTDKPIDSKPEVYFVASGVEDEAMQEFTTDSNTRAMAEYNRRRSTAGNYRTYTGDNITNIGNGQAMLNGMPVSSNIAVKKIEQDKLIDDIVNGIKYGQIPINSQEDLNAAIIQGVQGIINSTGVTSQEEAVKIAHIIQNKIK